jgi:ABC-type multidrug transport system fused ATPase/permease subunit
MNSIFKVFSIFTPKEQRYCAMLIVCMIVGAVLEAVGISAILPLISVMGNEDFLAKHPVLQQCAQVVGINNHIQFIMASAGFLILLYIIKNLYMAGLAKLQVQFSLNNQIHFATQLMAVYLSRPYLFHLEQNTAVLLRNISSSIPNTFSGMLVSIFMLITELITAFVIWLMLIFVDAFTAVIVAGLLGSMVYIIMRSVREKIGMQGKKQSEYAALYTKWLNQGLGAIKETKVLRKESYFLQQFSESYQNFGEANAYYLLINQLPRFLIETLVTGGLLLLIIIKLWLDVAPIDIVPLLGVLALAAFRLMPCANRIVNLSNTVKYLTPFFDTIYTELMIIKEKSKYQFDFSNNTTDSAMKFIKQIQVEKLSFCYPQGKDFVLNNISFAISKGSFTGIIGQSGAGKTTFVDILLGLLQPTEGQILVDGKDIFSDIRSWQANLAYVPQSIYLIDGTIKENIAMGISAQNVDDKKINKVLKMAELYDFVKNLPEGVYTKVGERGVKLSGGQRQRIGIARALYCDPEVLILDEATSALDNETEKNITDTILKLKGQITIIAIAHRVSTLENCDFKIRFDEGEAKII